MSVLINMEMPTSCDICPFMKTNDDLSVEDYRYMYCDFPGIGEFVTDYEATRHPDCPLVPVPPHGDLIDKQYAYQNTMAMGEHTRKIILKQIDALPVVIPAEEGE